jgi:hypothetical protein
MLMPLIEMGEDNQCIGWDGGNLPCAEYIQQETYPAAASAVLVDIKKMTWHFWVL